MKWTLIFIITFSLTEIRGQCDSLHTMQEANHITNLPDNENKFKSLSKFIEEQIVCENYENAIGHLFKKVELSKIIHTYDIEYQSLLLLDSLVSRHSSIFPIKVRDSIIFENILLWADFNERTGFHSRTIEKLETYKSQYSLNTELLSDNLLLPLETVLREIGIEYYRRNEYGIAINYLKEAIDICEHIDNSKSKLSFGCTNRSYATYIYIKMDELPDSMHIFYEHLNMASELVDLDEKSIGHLLTANRRLAEIYLKSNALDSAAYYISRCNELEIKYNRRKHKSLIINVKILLQQGKIEEAQNLLTRLYNIRIQDNESLKGPIFKENLNIINLLIKAGMFSQAQILLDFIHSENEVSLKAGINDNLNQYSYKKNYLDILMSRLRMDKSSDIDFLDSSLIKVYEFIDDGINNSISRDAKLRFASQSSKFSDVFLSIFRKNNLGGNEEIFKTIESSKTASLFKSWTKNQLSNFNFEKGLLFEEQKAEFELKRIREDLEQPIEPSRKDELYRTYDEIVVALDSIVDLLKDVHPTYYKMKYDWSIPKLSNIQASLASDEVLLNYFEGEEILYAMLITSDYSHTLLIDSISTLRDSISQNWKNIQNEKHWTVNLSTTSNYIYQKIVEPLKPYLKDRIIVSPSGSLFQVQFDALNTSADSENPYYLINDHAISYVPSATLFHQMRKMNTNNVIEKALLVAPEFSSKSETPPSNSKNASRSELYPLAFNVPEVKAISKYFSSYLLIDEAATKDSALALMSQADIIHLSTHAKSNMDSPEKSYVAFTNTREYAEEHQYKWYLDEMSKKQLPAKMIVLSACETGLGLVYKGAGAMSLANSCLYAGAQSVVASLWLAADNASKDIMTNLYANLDQGLSKDKALQKSKIAYLENNSGSNLNPYYWAGFSVMGNTNSLRFKRTPNYRNWLYALFGAIAIFLFFLQIRSAIKK